MWLLVLYICSNDADVELGYEMMAYDYFLTLISSNGGGFFF